MLLYNYVYLAFLCQNFQVVLELVHKSSIHDLCQVG